MAGPWRWSDSASIHLDEANLNKHCDASGVNLVRNGGFELWDAGDTAPSRWAKSGSYTLAKNSATAYLKYGTYSVKISAPASADCALGFTLNEQGIYYFRGKTLTISGWVHSNNTAIATKLYIWDSITGYTRSTAQASQGNWEKLSVTATINPNAGTAACGLIIEDTGTIDIYLDAAQLNVGEIALPFVPHASDYPVVGATHDTERQPCGVVWNPYGTAIIDLNGVNDVAWTALDVPTTTSSWCPDRTEAVLLKIKASDVTWTSGANYSLVKFREKGDADADNIINCELWNNARAAYYVAWVGLDSGGEFEYNVDCGHGSSTFYLDVWPRAYLIPL